MRLPFRGEKKMTTRGGPPPPGGGTAGVHKREVKENVKGKRPCGKK